ncbi:LLM class flavin-dependent oxidoreductase [Roseiarcaceae bacterium H3SJ34-1]|uniref:LLM class flavin-dependent oxidoreductase n=1 Tax=Terripilifer ovatus TaxID=3032367 RepID=UPI003AB96512|nr:LLM class flavin-dependent oxidoreductase [Roseiarcaceae bacterium H3SJ34-1]
MEFGIFDHVDATGDKLRDFYDARVDYAVAADRAGFRSYHVAEHHATPLGLAASPNVYLTAVAQRTERLRFGPLVYTLPLYHPLRLVEEICMLDQISGGRLEVGLGRGISPIEARYYGTDPDKSREVYAEYTELLFMALTQKEVTFKGKHFQVDNIPMQLEPLQKPHPPIWLGIGMLANAERAGKLGASAVSLHGPEDTRTFIEAWKAALPKTEASKNLHFGQSIFMVIDEDGERAMETARAGYLRWRESFHYLYYRFGRSPMHGERARTFDELMAEGKGVAGTPEFVRDWLTRSVAISGTDYLVGQFYFGQMHRQTPIRSVELFAEHIMPALRQKESIPA